MPLSDLFGATVAQAIAWLVTFGVSAGVSYALGWFPNLDPKISNSIKLVISAMLVAGVSAIATQIPDAFMGLKLLDAAVAIAVAVFNAISGVKFGAVKAEMHISEQITAREIIAANVAPTARIIE
jgi:hypothetical protein